MMCERIALALQRVYLLQELENRFQKRMCPDVSRLLLEHKRTTFQRVFVQSMDDSFRAWWKYNRVKVDACKHGQVHHIFCIAERVLEKNMSGLSNIDNK